MESQIDINNKKPDQTIRNQSMKSKSNLIVVALMTIIIVLLGLIWHLNFKNPDAVRTVIQPNFKEKDNTKTQQTYTSPSPEDVMSFLQSPLLLKNAQTETWETYTIKEVGVSFQLPSQITQKGNLITLERKSPEMGYVLCFTYEKDNKPLVINTNEYLAKCNSDSEFTAGTTSIDFTAGREGDLLDSQGYGYLPKKENDSRQYYYEKLNLNRKSEIYEDSVNEVINPQKVSILKVYGIDSYKWGSRAFGKGKVGAIINISHNPRYTGLVFQMKLDDNLTLALFDQILSTLKFSK